MSSNKYLYTNSHWHGLQRYEVIRESDHTYWISKETKISKKTMRIGSGYGSRYFQEETEDLIEKYIKLSRISEYKNKIDQLQPVRDIAFMELIISLKIPLQDGDTP